MKTAFVLAALSAACTLDPGRGVARLEAVELEAQFTPGERELDGDMLTDLGYVVRLDAIGVELFELELATFDREATEAAAGEHDHCHDATCDAESAENEAHEEHAEDEAAEVVATLPVDRDVDVLAGDSLRLTRVEPTPELTAIHLERAELHVGRIELSGSVGGGALTAEIPLAVSLDLDTHAAAAIDVAVAHDGPEHLSLHGTVSLEGPLFDGIDFAATGGFHVDDEDEGADALRSALAASLHLSLETEGHP